MERQSLYKRLNLRNSLLFFILAFIFFLPCLIKKEVFLAADTLYSYYPWKFYTYRHFLPHNILIADPVNHFYARNYNQQLKERKIQQWNPYILTGVPSSGSVSTGYPGRYYPLKVLLHYFFSPHIALMMLLFIHIMLMGYFMFLYLLEIGAGWRGALFGSVAYMFNGCAMVWFEFESWVGVSAYLPLLLLFIEKYFAEKNFFYAFAGGTVSGLMILTGNLQLNVYVAVLMFFYFVFIIVRYYNGRDNRHSIISILMFFTVTGIIGILIGSIEILPLIELISNSHRINRIFNFNEFFDTLGRVPFRYFVTLLFPDFFGNPILNYNLIPMLPSHEYMNYNELSLYTGIATLFAFTASILTLKNAFSRFYFFMILLVIAMMTGTYVYYPFFKLVPGMNKMNPTRLIFLFVFVFSAASGIGIKGLENLTRIRRNIFLSIALLILLIVFFIARFGNTHGITVWFNHEQFSPLQKAMTNDLNLIIRLRDISSPVIYNPLVLACTVFCTFLSFVFLPQKRQISFILLLSLLSFDLISFGWRYNTTVRPELIYSKTPAIEFLLKQAGPFRVVQDTGHGLYVNTLAPFKLEEIGGYGSFYPERINKLLSYIRFGKDKNFDRWVTFKDFSSHLFDLMNVRYVLTSPYHKLTDQKYKLVFWEDLSIYENMEAMPRAYIVHHHIVKKDLSQMLRYMSSSAFDMRNEVVLEEEPPSEFMKQIHSPTFPPKITIDKYTSDKISMTTDLSTNGWLILSDTYYPGWKAYVNGKEVTIHRANCNFKAIELPSGKHLVAFEYSPISFRTGWILSSIGVICALAGFVIFGVLSKKNFFIT